MRKLPSLLFLVSLLALVGCGKFDVINEPANGIDQAPIICIIEEPNTREGFRAAIESWLRKEGIQYRVLPVMSDVTECDWALKYYGLWSWDLALFLSDAEITAFHNGKMVGREKLRVGQWDAHKFEKGEVRIHKMMDMLFSKTSSYELPTKSDK
jgi:hypothetical protein